MDAMGYDVVEQRGSVEYENLGKSEMGYQKPAVWNVYPGGGAGGGIYLAGGGNAPHFGPLGTTIRNSGEVGQDMEYESGASARKPGPRGY